MFSIILFLATLGPIHAAPDFFHESDIVKTKSLKGIQPSHYKIDLVMPAYGKGAWDMDPYRGTVEIAFKPIKSGIKQVYLHVRRIKILSVNVTSEEKTRTGFEATLGGEIPEDNLIAINISHELRKSESYYLHVQFETTPSLRNGLFYAKNYRRGIWALSTLFQMRNARSAIPCMDHPILKAHFELCVTQPVKSAIVLSNMRSRSKTATKNGEKVCFHKTPKIPTYVLTLAVLNGYSKQSLMLSDKISSDIYFPINVRSASLKWVQKAASGAIKYLINSTGAEFPLSHLDFLFHQELPRSIWGIENYGLISFAAHKFKDGESRLGKRILAHEILHQYIGNDFTLSSWDDVCLQEGLTAYMDFKVSNVTMGAGYSIAIKKARDKGFTKQKESADLVPLIYPFKRVHQIISDCFDKAPVIIGMYDTDGLAGTKMNQYVGKLSEKYRSENVGEKEYFGMFEKVLGANLEPFFRYPGFPGVLVTQRNNQATLRTRYIEPGQKLSNKTIKYSLPIKLVGAKGPEIINEFPSKIKCPSSSKYCILDARFYYYRVFYEIEFYQEVVNCLLKPSKGCPDQQALVPVIADFLQSGIDLGIVPIESEPKSSDVKTLTFLTQKLFLQRYELRASDFVDRCLHAMEEDANEWERNNRKKCKENPWFKLADVF